MPVLEAMASGIPVVTSNRSALPEVAGDAALLVDTERTEDLADALRRITRDEDLQAALVNRGRAWAKLFSWERAVRETWQVYENIAKHPVSDRSDSCATYPRLPQS